MFVDMTSKSQVTKKKTDKLDFVKVKNFCVSNETHQKSEKTIHKIG